MARKVWAIGLLNRHSPQESLNLASQVPDAKVRRVSAVFFPGGGRVSRWLEDRLPSTLPFGAFPLVTNSQC